MAAMTNGAAKQSGVFASSSPVRVRRRGSRRARMGRRTDVGTPRTTSTVKNEIMHTRSRRISRDEQLLGGYVAS
jgi:hypothetical protein